MASRRPAGPDAPGNTFIAYRSNGFSRRLDVPGTSAHADGWRSGRHVHHGMPAPGSPAPSMHGRDPGHADPSTSSGQVFFGWGERSGGAGAPTSGTHRSVAPARVSDGPRPPGEGSPVRLSIGRPPMAAGRSDASAGRARGCRRPVLILSKRCYVFGRKENMFSPYQS